MPRHAHRSNDLFGAPESFSGGQLPTHLEVGKEWKQCRLDLEAADHGQRVCNPAVAKFVICFCTVAPN